MILSMLSSALVATALAALVALAIRLVRPGPATQHLLWLVVLLKFLAPVPAAIPLSLPIPAEWTSRFRAPPAAPAPSRSMAAAPSAATMALPAANPSRLTGPHARGADEMPYLAPYRPIIHRLGQLGLAVWLLGSLVAGMLLAAQVLRLRRVLAGAQPAPPELDALVRQLAAAARVSPPATAVTDRVTSPATTGIRRPRLLWPEALISSRGAGRRTMILHELAHVRRRDVWVGWLQSVATIIWWWYPPLWLVRRRLGAAAEEACDSWVVQQAPEARRAYAEALLNVAALCARPGASPVPLARALDPTRNLERRLRGIILGGLPQRPRHTAAEAMGAAVLFLLTLSVGLHPSRADDRMQLRATQPDAFAPADSTSAGVLARGEVRLTGHCDMPVQLGPRSWFLAFSRGAGATSRTLEMVKGASGPARARYLVDGRPADLAESCAWLVDVVAKTGFDTDGSDPDLSASGARVPFGPHVHRTSHNEALALWVLGRSPSVDDAGGSTSRPLLLVHQEWRGSPLHRFEATVGEGGEVQHAYTVDGRTESMNSTAYQLFRGLLSRLDAEGEPRS